MAGKQFTFFLSAADQLGFEEALRASGEIAFLRSWPASSEPEELSTSKVREMGVEMLDILIVRREDLPLLEFRPVRGGNVFSCDSVLAPVVEFGRCYVTDRFIRAGRLYRGDQYWDSNKQPVSKHRAFVEWAERLYKLAKASLTKIEQGCYAGAEAIELRKAGLVFEGLDIAIGTLES